LLNLRKIINFFCSWYFWIDRRRSSRRPQSMKSPRKWGEYSPYLALVLRLTGGLEPLWLFNECECTRLLQVLVFQVQNEFLGLKLFCCCKSNLILLLRNQLSNFKLIFLKLGLFDNNHFSKKKSKEVVAVSIWLPQPYHRLALCSEWLTLFKIGCSH